MLCCYTKKEKKTSTVQKENVNENFSTLQTLFFFPIKSKETEQQHLPFITIAFYFWKG